MESQPQNPEFRIDPENFHPCVLGFRRCPLNIFKLAVLVATLNIGTELFKQF